MRELGSRRQREWKTVLAMIRLYCRAFHRGQVLCPACEELARYALRRLTLCPFGEDKPTCAACPVHCYRPQQREEMRRVMVFAGPRLLFRHPLLTLLHLWEDWQCRRRGVPPKPAKAPLAQELAGQATEKT